MKEKLLSDKKIISTLEKKSFIEIKPICSECACDVMFTVMNNFIECNFDLDRVDNELFRLRINVY